MKKQIQALSFITRCLGNSADEVVKALRREICAGTVDWEMVVALANEHLLVPVLWSALKNKELDGYLPEDLREYFFEFYKLNLERNTKITKQIEEAAEQLNRIGIEPVLLKGAAHLVGRGFHDIGARIMTDIDILVPEQDIERSATALKNIGYMEDEEFLHKRPEHHHWAPLFRNGDYAGIELHRRLLFKESEDALDRESIWNNLEAVRYAGLDLRMLNSGFRMLHNLVHSEITDRGYYRGELPLRSLHETLVLVIAGDCAVDWGDVRASLHSRRSRKIFDAYLYLLHRVFRVDIPNRIKFNPGNILHCLRVFSNIRWTFVFELDKKLQGYNAWETRARYSRKEKDLPLWRGRARYTRTLLRDALPFTKARSFHDSRQMTTMGKNDRS